VLSHADIEKLHQVLVFRNALNQSCTPTCRLHALTWRYP
jgi:hypothetical protein